MKKKNVYRYIFAKPIINICYKNKTNEHSENKIKHINSNLKTSCELKDFEHFKIHNHTVLLVWVLLFLVCPSYFSFSLTKKMEQRNE